MITLNKLFQNGAVLQQKMPIPIWGNATPGNLLKAELAGVEAFTKVAAAGNFMLRLPPVNAGGPFTLKISDVDAGETVVFEDILVGEVWLASGQSNMEYQIGSDWTVSTPGVEKVHSGVNAAQAEEYYKTIKDPSKMRFITVKKNATGLEENVFEGEWKYMNKENAVMASAVAAWFGRFVQEKIDVPVGLIVQHGAEPLQRHGQAAPDCSTTLTPSRWFMKLIRICVIRKFGNAIFPIRFPRKLFAIPETKVSNGAGLPQISMILNGLK